MGGIDWIDLAHNMDRWQFLVDTVMNLWGPIKCGKFLDWLKISISRRTLFHGVS
jgi:hypothetical protein